MKATTLHTKFRPKSFSDVLGQEHIIGSLQNILMEGSAQTFLFSGPSGCGKTTISRLIGKEVGCKTRDIIEIDAATHSGVDDMRELTALSAYSPLGKAKLFIVDECHAISSAGWNSLLKSLEEPGRDIFWALCTTEPGKVPKKIKTRTVSYQLNPVGTKDLTKLLKKVCKRQEIDLPDSIITVIVASADGSPRQALVNLAACEKATSIEQAAEILREIEGSEQVIGLCRYLIKGRWRWSDFMRFAKDLKSQNAEGIRLVIINYMSTVVLNSTTIKQASLALMIMERFSMPYNYTDKIAPLLLNFAELMDDNE